MISGSIQPVILHDLNGARAEAYKPAVAVAMRVVSEWYAAELGRPFKAIESTIALQVVNSRLYLSNPLEALAQTVEATGLPNFGNGFMPYIYVGFFVGLGGFAGTVHWDRQAGLIGLSDACLTAISADQQACLNIIGGSPMRCSVSGQHGAIAHELMHALGWGEHTDTPGLDLSSAEYQEFPNCHLPDVVKAHILRPPWNIFLGDLVSPVSILEQVKGIEAAIMSLRIQLEQGGDSSYPP